MMTVLRPLAQSVCLQLSLLSVCLHPQPSPHLTTSTPHLSPFRQFSHQRLNNADSSVQQHGQRMILYFLAESNMNHTAPQTPRQNWKIGGVAPHENFLFSLFPPPSPILSAHGAG